MTKTAFIDIDNTLWQFYDLFYKELRKANKDLPVPEKWNNWEEQKAVESLKLYEKGEERNRQEGRPVYDLTWVWQRPGIEKE